MSVYRYTFADRLAMSEGAAAGVAVEDILLREIPGAVAVQRASREEDRSGIDWWVERSNGTHLGVDLKARAEDWAQHGHDDLALEVWSVVERRIVGWTLDIGKLTDYVLWHWQDTGRWCLLSFPMLARVFTDHLAEWVASYRVADQSTSGRYHSRCVFVPRLVIWRAIYDRYGGVPDRSVA